MLRLEHLRLGKGSSSVWEWESESESDSCSKSIDDDDDAGDAGCNFCHCKLPFGSWEGPGHI